ncbi:glucosamine kinase [Paracoccus isoporae]|uniref:Glucosamine kinase n=1 Tax=Paracoccus isoporae TaxID=591205 RepID=A0A1G7B7K6_9RHOB|nr:BadF/BadG/BcrA/BcrD ATPase family protein [Paracoccus isoporae]SDE23094.1 glucosamine kinase [Paracoccus isoporae]
MVFYLGIDGGGTGCRAAVADADGRILGRGTGGPANINTNVESAAENILAATAEALRGTDIPASDLVATLGLAGGAMQVARDRLMTLLPFAQAQIVNDGMAAARGALGQDDGILAAIGTGSVYAEQRGGEIRQAGGRGFLLGDEASGAVLGRTLLAEALRAADGFAEMTPLLAEVLEECGGIQGIIGFSNTARPVDYGAHAPRVVASDDPAARRIFDDAVAQVRHAIASLQRGDRLPVVFVGGLGARYAARLSGEWPVHEARGNAVDGALDMARQMGRDA